MTDKIPMEAKDTVMNYDALVEKTGHHNFTPAEGRKAQAEISYQAGIEKGRQMERERIIGVINDISSVDYPYGGDYKRAILQAIKGEK